MKQLLKRFYVLHIYYFDSIHYLLFTKQSLKKTFVFIFISLSVHYLFVCYLFCFQFSITVEVENSFQMLFTKK